LELGSRVVQEDKELWRRIRVYPELQRRIRVYPE